MGYDVLYQKGDIDLSPLRLGVLKWKDRVNRTRKFVKEARGENRLMRLIRHGRDSLKQAKLYRY
jgi:hypothetical protein